MKKILALIIAMLLALMCIACTKETPEDNSGNAPVDSGNVNEQTEDNSVPDVNPFEQLSTQFTIVCPEDASALYGVFADKLRLAIAERTGCTVGVAGDYTADNASEGVSNQSYEILLGNTNRKQTAELECPVASFAIGVKDKKIVIKGYNDDYVFEGILHFIDNYIGTKDSGKLFTLDKDFYLAQRGTPSAALYLSLGEGVVSDVLTPKMVKYLDAKLNADQQLTLTGMQGGCTDGEYFYFLLTDGDDSQNDQTRVVKVDPRTNISVKTGPIISVAHANDMTYDSKNDRFVVAWCSVDTFNVSYIDPDTLDVTGTGRITGHTIGCFGIAYDPISNTYSCAESSYKVNGYGLLVLDENLKLIERLDGGGVGHTAQGVDCDDKYIYYSQSPGGGHNNNVIRVYDKQTGALVKQFTIDLPYEIENVFWYDGAFYAGFNCSGQTNPRRIYRLDLNLNI